jgi:hypothetical protein
MFEAPLSIASPVFCPERERAGVVLRLVDNAIRRHPYCIAPAQARRFDR